MKYFAKFTVLFIKKYLKNILFIGSLCLKNVHVVVPEAVERGSKVEMKCLYDLENEVLYSVKWYRGDREFCRYSPRDVPPLKIFPIPGIEVDVSCNILLVLSIKFALCLLTFWLLKNYLYVLWVRLFVVYALTFMVDRQNVVLHSS